ncbi:DUF5403 family protein [Mycobacterium sp. C31M]
MNRVVSHLEGVHDAVGDTSKRVQRSAQNRLAAHRDTGAAEVTATEGDVDWFVNLEDEAALSIEFGHWTKEGSDSYRFVPGLYVLSTAAGLA